MLRLRERIAWALVAAFGLFIVAALARDAYGGPLDPPGPVGGTMRTIDDLLPTWGRLRSAVGGCTSPRFECLNAGSSVLDRETGLVWERTPSSSTFQWPIAQFRCSDLSIDGRKGVAAADPA